MTSSTWTGVPRAPYPRPRSPALKLTQGKKSERSRRLIRESALQLFSEQGYRGTSIREIADAAGLSTLSNGLG